VTEVKGFGGKRAIPSFTARGIRRRFSAESPDLKIAIKSESLSRVSDYREAANTGQIGMEKIFVFDLEQSSVSARGRPRGGALGMAMQTTVRTSSVCFP